MIRLRLHRIPACTALALVARSVGLDPAFALEMTAQDFSYAVAAFRARRAYRQRN